MSGESSQSKVGDIGIGVCPHHKTPVMYTTIFVTGANTVVTNGAPSSIVNAVGISSCGHNTICIMGSSTVIFERLPSHRVGDIGINYGNYISVTGSSDTVAGS